MEATQANFLKFLKKSEQLAIPIYQRTYSWTKAECLQLWSDVVRASRGLWAPDEDLLASRRELFVGFADLVGYTALSRAASPAG